MNLRSSGTSTLVAELRLQAVVAGFELVRENVGHRHQLVGAFLTESAFDVAPVPRPPQPISATWMRIVFGGMNLGNDDAGQRRGCRDLDRSFPKNSRRELPCCVVAAHAEVPVTIRGWGGNEEAAAGALGGRMPTSHLRVSADKRLRTRHGQKTFAGQKPGSKHAEVGTVRAEREFCLAARVTTSRGQSHAGARMAGQSSAENRGIADAPKDAPGDDGGWRKKGAGGVP